MKSTFLALVFLFSFQLLNAQTQSKLVKFRSTNCQMDATDSVGNWRGLRQVPDEDGKDILIVINLTDNLINIYNKFNTKLTTYGGINKTTEQDGKIENYHFKCIDNDGIECELQQLTFPNNPGVFLIVLVYPKLKYIYTCKYQP